MTPESRLAALESLYLVAREAHDELDVARGTGEPPDVTALEGVARDASEAVREALEAFPAADAARLRGDDARALAAVRAGIDAADAYELPVAPDGPAAGCADPDGWREVIETGGPGLRARLEACYGVVAEDLPLGDETLTRRQVLTRLGTEPSRARRRALFLALEPLWRTVDGDGDDGSPYRRLIADTAPTWSAGTDPVSANAAALGVTRDDLEGWCRSSLAAWRAAVVEPALAAGEPPMEPWDWWWRAGAGQRAVGAIPLDRALDVNRRFYASLGADVDAMDVRFDLEPRPGRPPVPVAFCSFGARPHLDGDRWTSARPIILASMTGGELGDLNELIHETGHAIHLAGIRTRPAFTEWPDADALTEAIADVVSWDTGEPAWLERWLPGAKPVDEALSVRGLHAGTILDVAWGLFEMRLLADPDRRPNDVWTEITSTFLGIAPHPEWSWWAIRGQLVQEPGYMSNYAIGSVITAAVRARIREARGPWLDGDPGWYPWMREHLFRFGLERPSGEVITAFLGGPPTVGPLVAELSRAGGPPVPSGG